MIYVKNNSYLKFYYYDSDNTLVLFRTVNNHDNGFVQEIARKVFTDSKLYDNDKFFHAFEKIINFDTSILRIGDINEIKNLLISNCRKILGD